MKTKTPIKVLTLTLFVTLISGFTLYKGGYLLSVEKKAAYIPDPNGGTGSELKSRAAKEFGLNTFQQLKLKGLFDPKYFDTLYTAPLVYLDNHLLSSSKSMVVVSFKLSKEPDGLYSSFFSLLLNEQFGTMKLSKKK